MMTAIRNAWALLLGMMLLQVGNGLQSSVLGVRGDAEGFSSATLGYVMAGYFLGFLGGTQATPWLLRRVGHVRVFAALASLISAAFILFGALVDPIAWFALRVIVGFCVSGIYVVTESWLNDSADNATRGQTMSAYITAQVLGVVAAQGLLNASDPGGYGLFVMMSVLVSVSFIPILLSAVAVPVFERTRRMSVRKLIETSPLGAVAMFLLGIVFACQFGMGAVYAAGKGLSTGEVSIFIGTIFVAAVICQPPIGWISDRMDRRKLILILTSIGTGSCLIVPLSDGGFYSMVAAAFVMGGVSNPLYSLIVAYVNDYLDPDDMAAASAGLILMNGVGAMGAPIAVGYLMDVVGDEAFFGFMGAAFALMTVYGLYRSTVRAAPPVAETGPMVPMTPIASQVASDVAWEAAIEEAEAEAEASEDDGSGGGAGDSGGSAALPGGQLA
ncbi:MAG: MFS transporter [Pseudomonadota bacterium]